MKILIPILLVTPALALAGQPIEERADMAPDGRVTVVNINGEIDISTWDRDAVELTGELGDGSELVFEVRGGDVRVEVEAEERRSWGGPEPTDLVLRVPERADLDVTGVSADIRIDGAGGSTLSVESVSGDVQIDGTVERLDLAAVSGDIEFRGSAQRSNVENVSGDVELEGLEGELEVSLVSGDVMLEGGAFGLGRFESVSGSLELFLEVRDGGRLSVETMSGDVELSLPANQAGEIKAQTFSGDIRSQFGSPQREKAGPGTRLDHVAGEGHATIRVESFSGDVRIERQ